jgi:hypothetical protein
MRSIAFPLRTWKNPKNQPKLLPINGFQRELSQLIPEASRLAIPQLTRDTVRMIHRDWGAELPNLKSSNKTDGISALTFLANRLFPLDQYNLMRLIVSCFLF